MGVLTTTQIGALQRALATCNQVLPRLEMLEAIAQVNPAAQPRVAELRAKREYACNLATTVLTIERQLGTTLNVPPVQPTSGMVTMPPAPRYTPPPPPPEMSYVPPDSGGPMIPSGAPSTGGYPTGYRQFIRRDPPLGDDEQRMYLAQGWRVEYEPETGWWGVRI